MLIGRVRERLRLVPPGRVAHLLLRAVRGRPGRRRVPRARPPVRRALPRSRRRATTTRPATPSSPRTTGRSARPRPSATSGESTRRPGQHAAVRPAAPGTCRASTSWDDLADPAKADLMGAEMQRRLGTGDVAVNLAATSLVANRWLYDGDEAQRALDRALRRRLARPRRRQRRPDPRQRRPDGTVGGLHDGRWYGGHYGWTWPHGLLSRRRWRALIGAMNAAFVTGDNSYLDLARTPLDTVLDHADHRLRRRDADEPAGTPGRPARRGRRPNRPCWSRTATATTAGSTSARCRWSCRCGCGGSRGSTPTATPATG